jgi:hypothetical protein
MYIFYYRIVANFSVYSLDAFLAQKNMTKISTQWFLTKNQNIYVLSAFLQVATPLDSRDNRDMFL